MGMEKLDAERLEEVAHTSSQNDILRTSFVVGGMVRHSGALLDELKPSEIAELNFRIQHYYDFHPGTPKPALRDRGIVDLFFRWVTWTIDYWDLGAWRCGIIRLSNTPSEPRTTYRVLTIK